MNLIEYGKPVTLHRLCFHDPVTMKRVFPKFKAGDVTVRINGVRCNTANLPTPSSRWVLWEEEHELILEGIETMEPRVIVLFVDQTDPPAFLPEQLVYETFGHVSAMIPARPPGEEEPVEVDHRCKCAESGLKRERGSRRKCSGCGWLRDGGGELEVPPLHDPARKALLKVYKLAKKHMEDPDTLLEEIADLAEPFVPEPKGRKPMT